MHSLIKIKKVFEDSDVFSCQTCKHSDTVKALTKLTKQDLCLDCLKARLDSAMLASISSCLLVLIVLL